MTKGVSGTIVGGCANKVQMCAQTDRLSSAIGPVYEGKGGPWGRYSITGIDSGRGNVADFAVPAGDNSFRKHAGSGAIPQGQVTSVGQSRYQKALTFLRRKLNMKIVKTVLVVLTLVLLGAMLAPSVLAQDNNAYTKRTIVTFSQPVEIPGQILPAGTYSVELVDSASYRHIVRFFNADRTRVVTTVLAIPNLRLKTTDKTVITFAERPINSPEALKAWFYPGDNFGQEFVYPKARAVELAQVVKEPVLAIPTATTNVEELKTAPLVAITPERREVPVAEVVQIPTTPVLVAENRTPEPLPQAQTQQQLPRTASLLPLMGLLSVASLGFAFVLKRIAG